MFLASNWSRSLIRYCFCDESNPWCIKHFKVYLQRKWNMRMADIHYVNAEGDVFKPKCQYLVTHLLFACLPLGGYLVPDAAKFSAAIIFSKCWISSFLASWLCTSQTVLYPQKQNTGSEILWHPFPLKPQIVVPCWLSQHPCDAPKIRVAFLVLRTLTGRLLHALVWF